MESKPIVYGVKYSSPVISVLFVAHEIELDIDYREISLVKKEHLSPEFLKLNPQHTVPTLNDNGKILWDSHAICTYLIDKYASNDRLYSKDYFIRGQINQRLHFNSNVLSVLSQLCFKPIVYNGANDFSDEHREKVHDAYKTLESFFQSDENDYLVGRSMTIADISCGCTMAKFHRIIPIDNAKFPKVYNWLNQMLSKEYFRYLNDIGWNELKQYLPKKYQ